MLVDKYLKREKNVIKFFTFFKWKTVVSNFSDIELQLMSHEGAARSSSLSTSSKSLNAEHGECINNGLFTFMMIILI